MAFYLSAKNGIYYGTISDNRVSLSQIISISGSSYLDCYKNYIFSISDGGISIFKDHKMIYQDSLVSVKPSHILFIEKYQLIICSNYHLGHLQTYIFDEDKTYVLETITFDKGSHIHQAIYDSVNDLIYVTNLGLDCVYVFKFSNNKLSLVKQINLDYKTGPRHLTISSNGYAYLLTEYSNEIYIIDTKSFSIVDTIKTLNHRYTKAESSAIRLSDDGRYLYALNRTEDYISLFLVNSDGKLKLDQIYLTNGTHARDFNFDGNYLVIANKDSNNLSLFVKNSDGTLSYISNDCSVSEPMMIKSL